MKTRCTLLLLALGLAAQVCLAAAELIATAHYPDGQPVPYILDSVDASPKYVVILFPGGSGAVDPRMENGRLVYGLKGNFLIRSRPLIVDREFATVTTNTTQSEERIQAVLDDLKRYGGRHIGGRRLRGVRPPWLQRHRARNHRSDQELDPARRLSAAG